MNISQWLQSLGLDQYDQTFKDNEIDTDILEKLTADDLKEMGVNAVGHRRKLLDAIAALRETQPQPASTAKVSTEAERRHLTVMFVDLVGSTQLSTQLDPEDMRAVILAYQHAVSTEIQRVGGNVAKYMGDGVLAYFGWPEAHENEAERAVRAGLAIATAVATQQDPMARPLSARIGIATGLVVVGDLIGEGGAQEAAVVGDTPNLAARLQGFASPGQVVVGDTTCRLLGGMFETIDLGSPELKGIAQRSKAFAVTGERALESRFAARAVDGLTALVGRHSELYILQQKWAETRAGETQLVLVVGEAGIGKSRLIESVLETIGTEQHHLIRFQCSPHHAGSPLFPVLSHLERTAGFTTQDTSDLRRQKLSALLPTATAEDITLLSLALGLPPSASQIPLDLSPQQLRFKTLQALISQLVQRAANRTTLLVLEDAHWIDPSTQEFLALCLESRTLRVLILVSARPGYQNGFAGHPLVTELVLNRLNRSDIETIARQLDDGHLVTAKLIDDVIAKSDGVPLYVEEMVKAALEANASRTPGSPVSATAVPASLHDSLMSRLDRLPCGKETAQIASVIGRSFDYLTLSAISIAEKSNLSTELDTLATSELIFRQGLIPDATYLFKHALVRDAAYESLLKTKRQALHARLLTTLESRSNLSAEVLAFHAQAASLTDKAIAYWRQAGDASMARPAYHEAIGHYTHAVELAVQKPNGHELELELRTKLGLASISAKGHSHADTCSIFDASQILSRKVQRSDLTFVSCYGLWCGHHVRSEIAKALESAKQLHAAGNAVGEPSHRMMGTRALAISALMAGRSLEAMSRHQEAYDLQNLTRDRDFVKVTGQDQAVSFNSYYSINLWVQGQSETGWERAKESVSLAKEAKHVNSLGYAYMHAALLAILSRQPEAETLAAEMLAFTTEHRLDMWRDFALQFLALHQIEKDASGALNNLKSARLALAARDANLFAGTLALEAVQRLLSINKCNEARNLVVEAQALLKSTNECFSEPELYRLQGEIHKADGEISHAHQKFDLALGLAHKNEANAWANRCLASKANAPG